MGRANFKGKRGGPLYSIATIYRDLCKNDGLTDRDAVWDLDSAEPKEACVRAGAHW